MSLTESGGVRNLRVFGSVARREATIWSDVDLLAELDSARTLMDLSGMKIELEKLLGYKVHIQLIPRMPRSIEEKKSLSRILQEAVPI
ncbi:MAG: nucleotidyltransferase family protein [Candidatus Dormibacteraceae bacterium]